MTQIRLVRIGDTTDADASHAPSPSTHTKVDPPTLYLEKIGTLWIQYLGKAERGVTYRLNKLPDGYTVWEKPRANDPSHVDKWCFGHPSRKFFDSPNKFFPHFLSLMEAGNTDACACVNCNKKGRPRGAPAANTGLTRSGPRNVITLPTRPPGRPPGRPAGRPPGRPAAAIDLTEDAPDDSNTGLYKAKGRQWVQGRVDEEGTPDPYRNNIDRLKMLGSLDTIIEEKMSADWRAERSSGVEAYFKAIRQKAAWEPRHMEIVLFVRALQPDEMLIFVPEIKRFMIRHQSDENDLKEPLWEAGIVTQTAQDLRGRVEYSVTSKGYRVEPLSSANSKDGKGIWKQYTYVRADQIRPFVLWKNLLSGLDNSSWHPTIEHAMLVMSTVTLVKRYRFKGKWPEAKVYCRGMYLGSELIVEGDFVHLLPESDYVQGITDIMRIDAITLDMWNLDKASGDDYDEGHPYNSAARITGRVYTISKKRAFDQEPVELQSIAPQAQLDLFGPWYARTPADKLSRVPFHRILGRCHDPDIIEQWLHGGVGSVQITTKPGVGMSGVIDARAYSSAQFRRIDGDRSWFWADTRVEALDLEEVNGILVSSLNPERDPKKYRKEIRVIEGTAHPEERLALQQAERRAFTRGSGANAMLASALVLEADDSKETWTDGKRIREDDEDDSDVEDGREQQGREERIEHEHFVNEVTEGLAMSDEEVLFDSEDEEERCGQASTEYGTPRSVPMVMID